MGYCTIADVNALVPQSPLTATTTPSLAQVNTFIQQTTERMDASFKNLGYQTPITGTASVALVREACAWGVLGLTQQVRTTAVSQDGAQGYSVWTKMYLDWFTRLANPKDPFELPDCPRTTLAVVKPLGEIQSDTTALSEFTYNDDITGAGKGPTFYMGMKF